VAMPLTPTRFVIKPELRKHERRIPKQYFCGHINIFVTLILPITAHWITMGIRYPFQRWPSKRYGKGVNDMHLVGSSTTVSSRHEVTPSYGPPSRPSNRTTHRAVGNILVAAHVVASPSYAVHLRYVNAPRGDQSPPILRPRQESVGSDKLN
jgi:hypothetical protein